MDATLAGSPDRSQAIDVAKAAGQLESAQWVEELRRSVQKRADEYERQRSLKDKLFPFASARPLTWTAVLYAEALWASIALAGGFVAFSIATAGLTAAAGFVLSVVLYMVPVLLVWALIGGYLIGKARRESLHQ